MSAHALAECYASLTALPTSPSVTPGQARRLIEENVTQRANEVVALAGTDYTEALQRMADLGLTSGTVYDILHVICAEKAEVGELRTFNGQDVRRMPPADRRSWWCFDGRAQTRNPAFCSLRQGPSLTVQAPYLDVLSF